MSKSLYFRRFSGVFYGTAVFFNDNSAIAYRRLNTTSWSNNAVGLPAVLWNPQAQMSESIFNMRTDYFGNAFAHLRLRVPQYCGQANSIVEPSSADERKHFQHADRLFWFHHHGHHKHPRCGRRLHRSEEHTSELESL